MAWKRKQARRYCVHHTHGENSYMSQQDRERARSAATAKLQTVVDNVLLEVRSCFNLCDFVDLTLMLSIMT
jgi:hypothetical protein